jgi:hypothetical protein
MARVSDQLLSYVKLFGVGLLSEQAPEIAKGVLIEFLKDTSVQQVSEWVLHNQSLWDSLGEHQGKLKEILAKIGGVDNWLTKDWVINSLRSDKKTLKLASLFLGWTKASNWLERQLEEIKENIRRG